MRHTVGDNASPAHIEVMSTHMVEDEHIDMLLTAGMTYQLLGSELQWSAGRERRSLTADNAEQVGAMLLAANAVGCHANWFWLIFRETAGGLPACPIRDRL